tara:strand:- start:104 stop:382 length:279 start_codon:yes stop_codon:yes gene_type:complete
MVDGYNNKQLFLKKLIYRSKYTGMKETDLLLGRFSEKYLKRFTYGELITYEKLLNSSDLRIWRLSINKELTKDEKEKSIIKLIKEFGTIFDV